MAEPDAPPSSAASESGGPLQAPALTKRSLALGLPLLLLWIFLLAFAEPHEALRDQHLLLVGGFGAIFTLFALKLFADFLPEDRRPTGAEYTFIFALLLAGIPTAAMGRLSLESAIVNHFTNKSKVEAGERALVPDFWAPNPHIGPVPRIEPPDGRCPYLELPPEEDGTPRPAPQDPPPPAEAPGRIEAARARCEAALAESRAVAKELDPSQDVLAALREIEGAAQAALDARDALASPASPLDARQTAYLVWVSETAAGLAERGPQCIRNADALRSFRKGKVAVPWGAWAKPLAYWFFTMLAFHLAIVFGLMVFRASWIERERLPFPYARLTEHALFPTPSAPQDDPRKQVSFPRPALAVAFLLGLLLCVKGLTTISETDTPAMAPSAPLLDMDLTGLDLISGVTFKLTILPLVLLFILLFPLDLLFTTVLTFVLVYFGLKAVLNMLGVSFGMSVLNYVFRMGGYMGITVSALWFNRREIRDLVRGLWSRAARKETDALGPRELAFGFFLSFAVFVGLVFFGEGETGYSALSRAGVLVYALAMIFVFNFHHIRMRAYGGFQYFDFNAILHTGVWFNWHTFGLTHSVPMAPGSAIAVPDNVLSYQSLYQMETFGAYSQGLGSSGQILDAFALADSTRAKVRDVFKGVAIATVLALAIGMPLFLIAVHYIGYDNMPMAGAWGNYFLTTNKAYNYYVKMRPSHFTTYGVEWVLLGAGIYIVCFALRRRYARFPIEPMGMFIAAAWSSHTALGTDDCWFTWVLAWLAKSIIFRWYGVRAFQEKVVPWLVYALMGIVMGMMLYLFLSAVLLARGLAL